MFTPEFCRLARPRVDRLDGPFLRAHRRGDRDARRRRLSADVGYGCACTRRAVSNMPCRATTISNLTCTNISAWYRLDPIFIPAAGLDALHAVQSSADIYGRVMIIGALQSSKLLFEFVRVEEFGFLLGNLGKRLGSIDLLVGIGPDAQEEYLEDGRNGSNQKSSARRRQALRHTNPCRVLPVSAACRSARVAENRAPNRGKWKLPSSVPKGPDSTLTGLIGGG